MIYYLLYNLNILKVINNLLIITDNILNYSFNLLKLF
jgi:hypothetical protein